MSTRTVFEKIQFGQRYYVESFDFVVKDYGAGLSNLEVHARDGRQGNSVLAFINTGHQTDGPWGVKISHEVLPDPETKELYINLIIDYDRLKDPYAV